MSKPITISVIVPIYNTEHALIRRCVKSILDQTYQFLELVIVDDGSTHETGNFCDQISKHDSRVRVIHQKNKGLSAARNCGVKNSTGDYITFVDSDDWIERSFITTLLLYNQGKSFDIIIGKIQRDFPNKVIKNKYPFFDREVIKADDRSVLLSRVLDFNSNIFDAPAKLINRNFLLNNHLEHDESLNQGAEGVEFNFRMFSIAQKIIFCDQFLYHYVINSDSITKTPSFTNDMLTIKCFESIKHEISRLIINNTDRVSLYYDVDTRMLYVLVNILISSVFHPNNLITYQEKRSQLKRLRYLKIVKEALKNGDRKRVGILRNIVLKSFELHFNIGLSFAAKVRYYQNNR